MYLTNCRIKNYKGFRDSGDIILTSGFNVVVGQNNAGKTAFLEALSLRFQDNLHRSITKSPEGHSSIILKGIAGHQTFLGKLRIRQPFLAQAKSGEPIENSVLRHNQIFKTDIRITSEFFNNGFVAITLDDLHGTGPKYWASFPTSSDLIRQTAEVGNSQFTINSLGMEFLEKIRKELYIFRAERLNIHQSGIETDATLKSDASNLAGVLHFLQSKNRRRWERFIEDVRTVFPDIADITVPPISNHVAKINIWFTDPVLEREDLAFPLDDCGTGIGQVLAMLYVVINSEHPRIILIDEPQSFLHPGAIRKLFEILRRESNQRHQYIVTTHSPTVVTSCSPSNVIMLCRENNETKAKVINTNETSELRLFLSEIGASLSDVFGADKILWVEGKTEEICFPLIIKSLLKIELLAIEIIGVTHVGDLESRQKEIVFEIYKKLCEGRGLLPPALGFCFDREKKSESDRADLTLESNGLIQFIPRRMYENYLLNPKAIAFLLNELDMNKSTEVAESTLSEWLNKNRISLGYTDETGVGQWREKVDAAKLLNDLFVAQTNARVRYDKIKHGVKLTEWIIQNSPTDFDELGTFLKTLLKK